MATNAIWKYRLNGYGGVVTVSTRRGIALEEAEKVQGKPTKRYIVRATSHISVLISRQPKIIKQTLNNLRKILKLVEINAKGTITREEIKET